MASIPITTVLQEVDNIDAACVSDEESSDDEPTNELKVREAANYFMN